MGQHLYLCSEADIIQNIDSAKKIKQYKLKGIISVQKHQPPTTVHNTIFQDVDVLHIKAKDCPTQTLISKFDDAADFIFRNAVSGGSTIVHCQAGISRSATICLAYLIKYQSLSLQEAFDFLKNVRPCIGPNFGFLGQLKN